MNLTTLICKEGGGGGARGGPVPRSVDRRAKVSSATPMFILALINEVTTQHATATHREIDCGVITGGGGGLDWSALHSLSRVLPGAPTGGRPVFQLQWIWTLQATLKAQGA